MKPLWRNRTLPAMLLFAAFGLTSAQDNSLPSAGSQILSAQSGASPSTASAPTSSQQHVAPLALKSPTSANPAEEKNANGDPANLHLIVGRSLFLNSLDKLRRVYVSNPTVLDAMTASPYEVVITAKAPGTSSLVMWSADGHSKMYTLLADVDVAGLLDSLHQALPGDDIA